MQCVDWNYLVLGGTGPHICVAHSATTPVVKLDQPWARIAQCQGSLFCRFEPCCKSLDKAQSCCYWRPRTNHPPRRRCTTDPSDLTARLAIVRSAYRRQRIRCKSRSRNWHQSLGHSWEEVLRSCREWPFQ